MRRRPSTGVARGIVAVAATLAAAAAWWWVIEAPGRASARLAQAIEDRLPGADVGSCAADWAVEDVVCRVDDARFGVDASCRVGIYPAVPMDEWASDVGGAVFCPPPTERPTDGALSRLLMRLEASDIDIRGATLYEASHPFTVSLSAGAGASPAEVCLLRAASYDVTTACEARGSPRGEPAVEAGAQPWRPEAASPSPSPLRSGGILASAERAVARTGRPVWLGAVLADGASAPPVG